MGKTPPAIRLGIICSRRIGTLRAPPPPARHAPGVARTLPRPHVPKRAENPRGGGGARARGGDTLGVTAVPAVTAVIVSTSEGEHVAPILAAIERGKPVLVEKPIALTVREADRVLEALKKSGGSMRVGYSRRYKERYQIAKEQVVQGRLGALT